MPPSLLRFLSIAIFSFGAPAFAVLAFFYWRNNHRGSRLFRVFTVVCAATFLCNMAAVMFLIDNPVFELAQTVLVDLLSPMMLHLTVERTESASFRRLAWSTATALLYSAAGGCAVARVLNWTDAFEKAPALILCACAALSLVRIGRARNTGPERYWNLSLFAAMLVAAMAALVSDNTLWEIAPDYFLLLFFSVHLYYSERLAFFDVFLRIGAFAALGVTVLSAVLMALPGFRIALDYDWNRAWLAALSLTPVWLFAPFLYRRLGVWVDRRALGRRFSPAGAATAFVVNLQGAATDEELRSVAASTIEDVFNCRVEIDFEKNTPAAPGDLAALMMPTGTVLLKSRDNHAPFLSDDQRLLESLTATLGLMLQNVRLRGQREDLRSLANRAELRALRAQINPHFLFNALNAIASFINTKPEAAEDTLAQLAEVFRYTLSRSQKEWVPLTEEIEFIRAYLAVEQARFDSRLQIEIDDDGCAFGGNIPSMIVQPLVENAIKHGTSQLVGVGKVRIEVTRFEEILRVQVSDNGPGFPAGFTIEDGKGHGLRSVRERLRGHYGGQAALHWQNDARWTCVSVEISTGAQRQCAF